MATFHFELVSPEQLVFTGDVTQVDVPGEEGDFGVLAGHAPYIATLKPGVLTIYQDGGAQRIVVRGGFAEVSPAGLTVLAEQAVPASEIDAATIAQAIKDAEEDVADCTDDAERDKLVRHLEQLKSLQAALAQ